MKKNITFGLYKYLRESVSEEKIIEAATIKPEPILEIASGFGPFKVGGKISIPEGGEVVIKDIWNEGNTMGLSIAHSGKKEPMPDGVKAHSFDLMGYHFEEVGMGNNEDIHFSVTKKVIGKKAETVESKIREGYKLFNNLMEKDISTEEDLLSALSANEQRVSGDIEIGLFEFNKGEYKIVAIEEDMEYDDAIAVPRELVSSLVKQGKLQRKTHDSGDTRYVLANASEGKIPSSPANYSEKDMQALKEQDEKSETVLAELSDENAAKELAKSKQGEAVQDPETKKWKVLVKESKVAEAKKDEEKKVKDDDGSKAKSELKSILRKIHKATTADEIETQLDRLAKSMVKYDGDKDKFDIIKDEAARKKEKIAAGDKEPEPEADTDKVEDEVEAAVDNAVDEGKIAQIMEGINATIQTDDQEVKIQTNDDGSVKTTVTDKAVEDAIEDPVEAPVGAPTGDIADEDLISDDEPCPYEDEDLPAYESKLEEAIKAKNYANISKYSLKLQEISLKKKVQESLKNGLNEGSFEDHLDEISIIKDLHEENQGHTYSDEQWVAIITELLASSKNQTFKDLMNFNDEIMGMLVALDNATMVALKESKINENKIDKAWMSLSEKEQIAALKATGSHQDDYGMLISDMGGSQQDAMESWVKDNILESKINEGTTPSDLLFDDIMTAVKKHKATAEVVQAAFDMVLSQLNESKVNEVKVGAKVSGKINSVDRVGKITSIDGDMAQVDFGSGDKYGIVLRRFKEGEFKVEESKVNEDSVGGGADSYTMGFAISVQKSLKDMLGVDVKIDKITNKLNATDRLGLESLKQAMEQSDSHILKQFLNMILENKGA